MLYLFRSIMLYVRWICSLYISLEDEISFDWSTCVGNVFISLFISPCQHCIARKRRDIMKSVEGWYSTCNNVFFYKFFVSMHWNRFFAYWMGGLKRVFGTLHWDILWKDGLNHVICDYLNRELGSIDKIVHWQAISVGIFGVQNSLELTWCALLKSCLFLYVCFQIFFHMLVFV